MVIQPRNTWIRFDDSGFEYRNLLKTRRFAWHALAGVDYDATRLTRQGVLMHGVRFNLELAESIFVPDIFELRIPEIKLAVERYSHLRS
jgi:hypothetical protein